MLNKSKYTYDDVREYIESKGCKLLSDKYVNNKTILKIQCGCGEIFNRSFQDFKNKNRYTCQFCSGNKLRYKDVKKYIESKDCELLSTDYRNASTKLHIRCKCGNDYYTAFGTFKKDKQWQCQKCGDKLRVERMKNRDIDVAGFYTLNKVKTIIGNNSNTKVLSNEYINCFEKLNLLCECGEVFKQNFSHIKNKINNNLQIKCPKCMKRDADESFRFTIDDLNKKLIEVYGDNEFVVLNNDGYVNFYDYVTVKHIPCGYVFKTKFKNITNQKRLCKNCQSKYSKGVIKIMKYLDCKHIKYIKEKIFNECKDKKPLPFDFYLQDYNLLIEFDGEQHYKSFNYFGGEEGFKKLQYHDKIKNKYCKDNNIPLLRIRYDEVNNINNILDEFIYRQINTEVN